MKRYWSSRIREMVPYVPGEQPRDRRYIKLNTNENPYPPSPKTLAAIHAAADEALRLYPDPTCLALREAIAARYGLTADCVFCGNGSDEVLSFAFQAFFDRESPVTFPDITYSFYEVFVKYLDLTAAVVPLKPDLSLPVESFLRCPGGAVIANPNAPTGLAVRFSTLEEILRANRQKVIVVDEAYVDFCGESAAAHVMEHPNLVVVQTASKSRSLAGLRVGWAVAQPDLIAALCCVRDSINSYPVDRLAAAGARAAVLDEEYRAATCAAICETRERTAKRLARLGFEVLPSQANFLFVRHPAHRGKTLFQGLRSRGILVRRWDIPRIAEHLRVSIGTDAEMDALCQALEELTR